VLGDAARAEVQLDLAQVDVVGRLAVVGGYELDRNVHRRGHAA
jgi:hypothetical protein